MKGKISNGVTSNIKKNHNFFNVIKTTLETFPELTFQYTF